MTKLRRDICGRKESNVFILLHVAVIILSLWLVLIISILSFEDIYIFDSELFEMQQFAICVLFMLDFFVELYLSKNRGRYFATHLLFFLVAIPYTAIFKSLGISFSQESIYLLRYIPLVRGGYALAIIVGWLTDNRATGLFFSYLITLLSIVYFASLTFYIFERGVNSAVVNYSDALWWAAMDVTTVGSNIIATTPIGKVLSVVLAALGMMMFPIFTVYVTNLIKRRNETSSR